MSRALKNDEILFQIVFGHRESVKSKGTRNAHFIYLLLCDLLFYGYTCTTKENMML